MPGYNLVCRFRFPRFQFDHLFTGCHQVWGHEYRLIRCPDIREALVIRKAGIKRTLSLISPQGSWGHNSNKDLLGPFWPESPLGNLFFAENGCCLPGCSQCKLFSSSLSSSPSLQESSQSSQFSGFQWPSSSGLSYVVGLQGSAGGKHVLWMTASLSLYRRATPKQILLVLVYFSPAQHVENESSFAKPQRRKESPP